MKKIILFLLLLSSTLATASTINFNFNPNQNSSQVSSGIIYSDSIVLQITTTSQVLCKYSTTYNTPYNLMTGSFDDNFETIHKKTLVDLHNGVYKYYIKCRPITDLNNASTGIAQLEATFKISNPISAQIVLTDPILKSGKHEISLITTKIPIATPVLKYSYDGIIYTPIVIHGSGNSWKGFLIIPSGAGEKIGSFKFEARDIEGRLGTKIIGDNVFTVDTRAPPIITSLEASGEYNQIKLKWVLEDTSDIKEIKIYRSQSPNIDRTNLYKTLEEPKQEYSDTNVKDGKTYYYKIAPVDAAGNMADLSREIQATSLLTKATSSTGLSPVLVGSVDALLSEIEILENDIRNADNMIDTLSQEEKNYMKIFKLIDNFKSAKSELSTLKESVKSFKLTDMTKEVLDGKLASSRIKLNIIKKKIPDTITKIDSSEIIFKPTQDTIRKAVLEYSPELSPSAIDETIKKSLELITKDNLQIKSKINIFEIIYLDGTKSTKSILEHFINGTLEDTQDSKLLLKFPSGSLDLDSLSIKNLDYSPEKKGLISFEPDTKKITYTLEEKLDTEILKEISISPLATQKKSTQITGYFLSSVPTPSSNIATFLIILASGLIGYLLFIKQQQKKEVSSGFLEKARQVKTLQKEGKLKEADNLYSQLKIEYLGLSNDQKHEVFNEIKNLSKK